MSWFHEAFERHLGGSTFLKKALRIALPSYISAILFSLVGFLDNFMIGALGSDEAAGVNISNQFFFLFGATVQGTFTAVGVFTSQYFGAGKQFELKQCITATYWLGMMWTVIYVPLIYVFSDDLIGLYTTSKEQIARGREYISVVAWSYFLAVLNGAIIRGFQAQGITWIGLIASMSSIVANAILNRAFIFGDFGVTALGVAGAAYATVYANVISTIILFTIIFGLKRKEFQYIFWPFIISKLIIKKIASKALLIGTQMSWAILSVVQSFFIFRGNTLAPAVLGAVSGVQGLFFALFPGIAVAVGFFVGKELGQKNFKAAEKNSKWLLKLSVIFAFIFFLISFASSWGFAKLYNTTVIPQDQYEAMIRYSIWMLGGVFPIFAINLIMQASLRAGGEVFPIALDSILATLTTVLVIALLAYFAEINFIWLFFISKLMDIFKTFILRHYYRKKKWLTNLTE